MTESVQLRDRETDRTNYPNVGFNNWLDEVPEGETQTRWETIADTGSAWQGWEASRQFDDNGERMPMPSPSLDPDDPLRPTGE